eukprot:6630426-Lingulodinium_polyedra.AAC.1
MLGSTCPRPFGPAPPTVGVHMPLEEAHDASDCRWRALPDVVDAAFAVGGTIHHRRLQHPDRVHMPE